METRHTPTPYNAVVNTIVAHQTTRGGTILATIHGCGEDILGIETTKFIARACNNIDPLISAVDRYRVALQKMANDGQPENNLELEEAEQELSAALAKARGEA